MALWIGDTVLKFDTHGLNEGKYFTRILDNIGKKMNAFTVSRKVSMK